ncbi:MAG: hypothetical protein H0V89_06435 [Deltaproteobacteria bacterium]|nr:hypothetical protein [Deltaproteobacteria bacterium]
MNKNIMMLAFPCFVACSEAPTAAVEADDASAERCRLTGNIVATDIDGTLTVSHEEWEQQLADPTYDQEERPDAALLMRAYAAKGYTVAYITARWSGFDLSDGRSSTEATLDWLVDHDFPVKASMLFLAPDEDSAEDPVDYKTDVLDDLTARGATLAYAYGNTDTDVEAYLDAGFDDDNVFHVSVSTGDDGTVGLPDDEAYDVHIDDHMGSVPSVCR